MKPTFGRTKLEQEESVLKLTDFQGNVLVEINGADIEDHVRRGFLDPSDYHFSLFELFRMRREAAQFAGSNPARSGDDSDDEAFLAGLSIRWK